MDPLHTDRKLQEESTKKEGKEMLRFSVREGFHDKAKRVAHEHSHQHGNCFNIETNRVGNCLHHGSDKTRDCEFNTEKSIENKRRR
mmetsp:Transcript_16864/g.24756  ORF Transcript_16864/g.24756 Transcript_16864/m.24756 type:complete len:86 (+) Transcript_16864:1698-1955(+)